ncbi:hypothetical protein AVEN_217309-1, partial [Araneus ventricosus]
MAVCSGGSKRKWPDFWGFGVRGGQAFRSGPRAYRSSLALVDAEGDSQEPVTFPLLGSVGGA